MRYPSNSPLPPPRWVFVKHLPAQRHGRLHRPRRPCAPVLRLPCAPLLHEPTVGRRPPAIRRHRQRPAAAAPALAAADGPALLIACCRWVPGGHGSRAHASAVATPAGGGLPNGLPAAFPPAMPSVPYTVERFFWMRHCAQDAEGGARYCHRREATLRNATCCPGAKTCALSCGRTCTALHCGPVPGTALRPSHAHRPASPRPP